MSPDQLADLTLLTNAIQAVGSIATPIVGAILGAKYIRQQTVHNAALSEKVKHYGTICPRINSIYAYRLRRGDFLARSPESILEDKRVADHEFWAFYYVWSDDFRRGYLTFMESCFLVYQKEGTKALIKAESQYYPIKPLPQTVNADGTPWPGFTETQFDPRVLIADYAALMRVISSDLGLR